MTSPAARFPFTVIAKPAGARCNIDCTYCFYLEKSALFAGVEQAMAPDVLEAYVRDTIAAQPGKRVTFIWQGGEPTLLGVDFFRRAVALQAKHADGKTVENAFQTNGILIDEAWCALFRDNRFLVGLSLDGPEDLHDRYRRNRGRKGTFRQVMRGLELLQKHGVEVNTLTVLNRENAREPLRVYDFLKQVGSRFHQYIPIVERRACDGRDGLSLVPPDFAGVAQVTDWSVRPADYGRFLTAVFDEWVRRDVGRVFVQMFDSTLSVWAGRGAGLCVFAPECGRGPALEHTGDLFACDHYVYPDHRLGNIVETPIAELVDGPRARAFGRAKSATLPGQCRRCEVRFACHGGCPKHRIARTADGEAGLNHFCQAYKTFFRHSAPEMRTMAGLIRQGRAPGEVMALVRERDRRQAVARTRRNDPCPCGSGRKYKRCCGASTRQTPAAGSENGAATRTIATRRPGAQINRHEGR